MSLPTRERTPSERGRIRADEGKAPGWARGRPLSPAAIATIAASAFAVVAAWLLPRGPLTTSQAVLLLCGGLLVGAIAGVAWPSRRAYLVGPLVLVLVFELRWLVVDGPMTDLPPLGSVLALVPLVFGRGWLALLVLLPMLVGAAAGRRFVRWREGQPVRSRARREVPVVVAAVVVLALLAGLLVPARTPPILGADGQPLAGSVAELTWIEVGGHQQALLLRGQDASAPVVLYLEGGPGGTGLGAMRLFGEELEASFVVATWDQRGTGRSYAALDPKATLTLDRAVQDLLEVTDHLRERFGQDRIYLLGNSWGTTLAVLAAQRHPERYHAIVGTGQMVSQRETDQRMYAAQVAEARAAGDDARLEALETLGPPPYDDIASYAPLLVRETDRPEVEWPANVLVSEYTLLDKVNSGPALVETFATLYPQLQDIDFRRDVPQLDVPLYVVDGDDEDPARADVAAEWLATLEAPRIAHEVIADAAHRPHLQQPAAFARIMRDVLDQTGG